MRSSGKSGILIDTINNLLSGVLEMGGSINKSYEIAKEKYASYGVDTDKVINKLKKVPFAVHGWQADDFGGFEKPEAELAG